jgi:hypothetical protein
LRIPAVGRPKQGSNNAYRTGIGMPPVGPVAIPPGVAGSNAVMMDLSVDTAQAAVARS